MANIYHAFKSGTLTDNPLGSGATQANSAGFAALPVVASPDILKLTIDPLAAGGVPEIVYVTAHTSASTQVTITRGQETTEGGSVARSHALAIPWVSAITPQDIGNIVADQIANDTITATQIAANAIGASEIAANAVGASELADNAVDTAAILNAAVTLVKLNSDVYRTGTWAAQLDQGGTVAATVNESRYTRVGDLVTISARLTATAAGTATFPIIVKNLPFTVAAANGVHAGAMFHIDGAQRRGAGVLVGSTTTNVRFQLPAGFTDYYGTVNGSEVTLANTDQIFVAFSYFTNDA